MEHLLILTCYMTVAPWSKPRKDHWHDNVNWATGSNGISLIFPWCPLSTLGFPPHIYHQISVVSPSLSQFFGPSCLPWPWRSWKVLLRYLIGWPSMCVCLGGLMITEAEGLGKTTTQSFLSWDLWTKRPHYWSCQTWSLGWGCLLGVSNAKSLGPRFVPCFFRSESRGPAGTKGEGSSASWRWWRRGFVIHTKPLQLLIFWSSADSSFPLNVPLILASLRASWLQQPFRPRPVMIFYSLIYSTCTNCILLWGSITPYPSLINIFNHYSNKCELTDLYFFLWVVSQQYSHLYCWSITKCLITSENICKNESKIKIFFRQAKTKRICPW